MKLDLPDGWYRVLGESGEVRRYGITLTKSFDTYYHWACVINGEIVGINGWTDDRKPVEMSRSFSGYMQDCFDVRGREVVYALVAKNQVVDEWDGELVLE